MRKPTVPQANCYQQGFSSHSISSTLEQDVIRGPAVLSLPAHGPVPSARRTHVDGKGSTEYASTFPKQGTEPGAAPLAGRHLCHGPLLDPRACALLCRLWLCFWSPALPLSSSASPRSSPRRLGHCPSTPGFSASSRGAAQATWPPHSLVLIVRHDARAAATRLGAPDPHPEPPTERASAGHRDARPPRLRRDPGATTSGAQAGVASVRMRGEACSLPW